MTEILQGIVSQWSAQSWVEVCAVLLAMAYLILIIRQNLWAWPAAFCTALYSWLFFDVTLYMESLLNLYYLVMAVYGFYQWRGGMQSSQSNERLIQRWSLATHLCCIGILTVISLINGWVLQTYTDASLPYLDAATTWFAVFTTYLVAKKVFENWYYWILIDFASIYLYLSKDLYLVSAQMLLYLILCFAGIRQWRAALASQRCEG